MHLFKFQWTWLTCIAFYTVLTYIEDGKYAVGLKSGVGLCAVHESQVDSLSVKHQALESGAWQE